MSLVNRAKNMLTSPKEEWAVISAEEPTSAQFVPGYLLPMAALPFLVTIIGSFILGKQGIVIGLAWVIVYYLASVAAVYLSALVINILAIRFNSEQNFGRSLQLVVYGFTATWVGAMLIIIPIFGVIGSIAGGIYSIYLLYLGLPYTMKTPQDKAVVYMIVAATILIVMYAILIVLLTTIGFAIYSLFVLSW